MKLINKIYRKTLIYCFLTLTNLTYLASQKIPSGANLSFSPSNTLNSEPASNWQNYKSLASYIIGASLFISLIVVIYHVATNSPHAKQAIVSWLIALIIYCIAITIFG